MGLLDLNNDTTAITCCSQGCGLTFSVPALWVTKRREDHSIWYCPNGHQQHFPGKSEAERLKTEKEALERRLRSTEADRDWQARMRQAEERRTRAAKGQVTKMRRRLGAGVCPCCNRTFQQVADHMKTKHPEWAPATTGTVQP